MKIDSISSLAEILPFFGTLDEGYKIVRMMNRTTWDIWSNCKAKIGKVVKRKWVKMEFESFVRTIEDENSDSMMLVEVFEIDRITVKTIDDYRVFREILEQCKVVGVIKIRDLMLSLSKFDDFKWTYGYAWIQREYDKEDRMIDEEYNLLISTIKKLKLNVESINSFLYLNELKNRNLTFLSRILVLIGDDENDENSIEQIMKIIKQNFRIPWFCIILDSEKWFDIEKKVYQHFKIF